MGLDTVELIIAIEERFDITIPDNTEVQQIATVGDMHGYIWRRVYGIRRRTCESQRTFYQIRRSLMRSADVPRWYIRPQTRLDLALPTTPARKKQALQRLRHETGVQLSPDPGESLTVASLVHLSVAQAENRRGYPLIIPPRGWTYETVWEALQEVVIKQTCVRKEQVHPNARFVQDLGLD